MLQTWNTQSIRKLQSHYFRVTFCNLIYVLRLSCEIILFATEGYPRLSKVIYIFEKKELVI